MSVLQEIFSEYTRMRENGLEPKEALRALKAYIEPLAKSDREFLAQQLRQWEQTRIAATSTPPEPASSVIKPLHGQADERSETPSSSVIKPLRPQKQEEERWVECTNCGSKNRIQEVFCYACGHILSSLVTEFDTRHFEGATNDLFSAEYFGPDSVLKLGLRDIDVEYEVRPQLSNREIVIGRSTGNAAMMPDIDLEEAGASNLGVSRLHLSIVYQREDNTLQLYDLGSANGTFINGQRLHPKENRVMRHGDELRLGHLVLSIAYAHPGKQIDT